VTPIRNFVASPFAILMFIPLVACAAEIKSEPGTVGSTAVIVDEVKQDEEAFRATYEVVRGDTLIAIADRFGIHLNDLVRENNIADPTRIYVGQILLIPPSPDKDGGPLLTIPPPTDPQLPMLEPTTSVGEE
jgi:LysM repeat protein